MDVSQSCRQTDPWEGECPPRQRSFRTGWRALNVFSSIYAQTPFQYRSYFSNSPDSFSVAVTTDDHRLGCLRYHFFVISQFHWVRSLDTAESLLQASPAEINMAAGLCSFLESLEMSSFRLLAALIPWGSKAEVPIPLLAVGGGWSRDHVACSLLQSQQWWVSSPHGLVSLPPLGLPSLYCLPLCPISLTESSASKGLVITYLRPTRIIKATPSILRSAHYCP